MGVFNPTDDSIHLKVVYYGPAFGGKTTNLAWVKALLDPDGRHGMLSVDTGADSTLFFDHLPLRIRLLGRYAVRFQGYTVPGQVRYDATRRLVLKGADGIVFVADSRRSRLDDDVESLRNLRENAAAVGLSDDVPVVIQFNQRDRDDAASLDELEALLNSGGMPSFPAVAVRGVGVLETLRGVMSLVWRKAHAEYGFDRRGLNLEDALGALDHALAGGRREPPGQNERIRIQPAGGALDGRSELDDSELLQRAVEAGLELAELAGNMAETRDLAVSSLGELAGVGQQVTHDLRKPLCALKNALHLLKAERHRLERPQALDLACDVVEEMARQLSDAGTRFEGADRPLEPEPRLDLLDLVQTVLRQWSYPAAEAAVELRSEGEFPVVRAPRQTVLSILNNLVGNAVRYHDPKKAHRSVTVIGRRSRAGWLVGVRDNGPGLAPGDRRWLFQRHRRGGAASGKAGTGLGLYLVDRHVRAISGRIGVRSRAGRGTLFWFLLPAERIEEPAGKTAATAENRP